MSPRVATSEDGYVLLEVMLALTLMASLASLVLPGLVRGTGRAALRITGFEVAALLRMDRNSAIASGRDVTTTIGTESLRSGATGQTLWMPADIALSAPLVIRFMPDGRATDGTIIIASDRARVTVAVISDTGAIRVATP